MKLLNRLRELRLKGNLTQQALADKVDVTRQTIIAVEKDRFVPSVKLALRLGAALGVPIDELFWLEEAKGGKS